MSEPELHELFDAYLDDELTPDERAAVEELLRRSAAARAEVEGIQRVRDLVRGLPAVEPPFGFFERMELPRKRGPRSRAGVAASLVGAAAAVMMIIVGLTPGRVAPPIDDFVERHHAMLVSDPASLDVGDGYDPMSDDRMDDTPRPFAAPEGLPAGYRRQAVYTKPEVWHVVYSDGRNMVSVFQQPGLVDWDSMPEDGDRMMMGDDKVWVAGDDRRLVVLERSGLVVTVVGRVPKEDALLVAGSMPEPPAPTVTERIADGCRELTSTFGFPD
jgi:hypothetical protein